MSTRASLLAFLIVILSVVTGCSSDSTASEQKSRRRQEGEYLARRHDECRFPLETPRLRPPPQYPWTTSPTAPPKISKEYFRCKGSTLNPVHIEQTACGDPIRLPDCEGGHNHSLPLREGQEHVYAILIDLLNHIQEKTGKRVAVTCGHRCPTHNSYSDPSVANRTSKHMVGAEVDFYVQGMEDQPQTIVDIILDYYRTHPSYHGDAAYQEFNRYTKPDTDVTTYPWFNKEVFVKLYKKNEGRNFDNRHPYPYLAIQVKYDRSHKERVSYSWKQANRGYLRS